ncbi:FimV/HubP family polar landmark protein [Microbulbifer pacificus]|uniref:FimV/HubP family polar landmark protein n=1 Tax=Microbulbifer pacificus TaxID=407164 RepID=UPI000CF38FB6|nr:FimV/HubP family polar landmark protein [Microbulbifer pacificus]
MRVQKLALAVGLVSALGGNGALALGLGEIKLNSTLNQPLNAEIKLLQTRGLGENEIKVRLASSDDFERAGVDRAYLLDELQFSIDYSNGEPVVRISSRAPIREPFLNFLVETRWPSGRLLREYTLLMDLPAFSTNTASQPVQAAERERQQIVRNPPPQTPLKPTIVRQPEPVQAPVEQPESEYQAPQETVTEPAQPVYEEPAELQPAPQPETVASSGSRVYGPVEANKTLWEIARDNRETREVSVQQTMLAIQRLNPEAFINNNINLLKKGAVLRLPTNDEVRSLTRTEAVSQVATQNEAWRERVGDTEVTGAPLDGRAVAEETVESDALEGRVSLAAPGDNESVLSGSGSGTGDSEALEGELAVSEEELDKSRLENTELQERIGELNEQIDTMERMVEVSNDELQAVQAAAAQSLEGAESEAEDTSTEDAGLDVGGEIEGVDASTATPEQSAVSEPEAAEVAPENDEARNRVVVQTRPEPTLVERVMDNIVPIGVGAGALLVALFGFVTWRRRREEEEAIRQVEAEMAAERAQTETLEFAEADDNLSAVEELEASESFDLDQLGEVETDDPIGEAEIHLSLAQYQEAEAKLLTGLRSAPANVDARLMLLEVYAQQKSAEQFDEHYRQLLSYSDGPAADRAARLRETIPGIAPFVAPEVDFSSESLEAAQLDDLSADFDTADFNLDASFDDLDEFSGNKNTAVEAEEDDELGLLDEFSLDLDDEVESAPQGLSADDGDFSLDLDLGDELDSGLEGGFDGNLESEQSSLEMAAEGPASESTSQPAADSELEFDDLIADGELDLESLDGLEGLGDLDIDTDFDVSAEPSANTASTPMAEEGGLDFELDLTPMEDDGDLVSAEGDVRGDAVPAGNDTELSVEDGNLDGLDLDSIDLDSIDLGDFDDLGEIDLGGESAASVSGGLELEEDLDVAVAEESAPRKQAAADDEALGDLGFNLESDLDSELNLLEGSDEVSTKLELAQAYLDMGDKDGAREILGEVVEEATGEHQQRAKDMLKHMG